MMNTIPMVIRLKTYNITGCRLMRRAAKGLNSIILDLVSPIVVVKQSKAVANNTAI